jgi:hypothetical protein
MKNNNKNISTLNISLLIISICILGFSILYTHPKPHVVMQSPTPHVVYTERVHTPYRPREYRPPPVREWKPGHSQQMGLLTSETGNIRPLYGRASQTNRDRWHYWTTTGGKNLYPLPVEVNGRACEEDIGCSEIYGSETVRVHGADEDFKAKLYNVNNMMV